VDKYIDSERTACGLDQWQKTRRTWGCRVVDDCDTAHRRGNLLEQLKPLRADSKLEKRKASDIAPGMRKAGDKSGADRIRNLCEYDRYGGVTRWTAAKAALGAAKITSVFSAVSSAA
jgi:hypothetical protein